MIELERRERRKKRSGYIIFYAKNLGGGRKGEKKRGNEFLRGKRGKRREVSAHLCVSFV